MRTLVIQGQQASTPKTWLVSYINNENIFFFEKCPDIVLQIKLGINRGTLQFFIVVGQEHMVEWKIERQPERQRERQQYREENRQLDKNTEKEEIEEDTNTKRKTARHRGRQRERHIYKEKISKTDRKTEQREQEKSWTPLLAKCCPLNCGLPYTAKK